MRLRSAVYIYALMLALLVPAVSGNRAEASGSQCLTTFPIFVNGTAVICPDTPMQRKVKVTATKYVAVPVQCPAGSGAGSVVQAPIGGGGGGYTGGNTYVPGQSSGGYIPPVNPPTAIAQDTCIYPTKFCTDCSDTVPTGSGVAVCNGTYLTSDVDLSVPVRSVPLVFARYYRSNRVVKGKITGRPVFDLQENTPLGFGWYSPFFARVEGGHYIDGEGNPHYFSMGSDGGYTTDMKNGLSFAVVGSSGSTSGTTASPPTGYEVTDYSGIKYIFNSSGRLASMQDTAGNIATMGYDSSGRLSSVMDVTGRTVYTLTYGADNHVQSVTDLAGRTVTYAYSGGNLVSASDLCGNTTAYTYNSLGMTSKTTPYGTYSMAYQRAYINNVAVASSSGSGGGAIAIDTMDGGVKNPWNMSEASSGSEIGLVTSVVNPAGQAYSFSYDFTNSLFISSDYNGNSSKLVYASTGDLSSRQAVSIGTGSTVSVTGTLFSREVMPDRTEKITDEAGNVVTVRKDEWDNVVDKVDGEGNEWKYTYSGKLLTSETDPMGVVTKYECNAAGKLTKKTEAAGTPDETVTINTYDQWGNLLTTTKAGATVTYTYNGSGLPVSVKDPMGNTTTVEYDQIGNATAIVDPLGNRTEITYNTSGKPLTVKDALGNVTAFAYDSGCRLSSMTDPKGNVTKYGHDYKGNVTKVVNALNQGIALEYDGQGNMVKATELGELNLDGSDKDPADNLVTAMTYDSSKRRTSITDPAGNVTRYEYNNAGCGCPNGTSNATPAKITDPLGNVTINAFDKAGRVIATTDRNGNTIAFMYDPVGRLLSKSYPDGNGATYSYDSLGRLMRATNSDSDLSFEYNAQGMVARATADGRAISYDYDLDGNRKSMTDATGRVTIYTYDALGSLTGLKDGEKSFGFTFDKLGNRTTLSYPNGITTSYGYDSLGQVTSILSSLGGNAVTRNSYTYDRLGNRLANNDLSQTRAYTYDQYQRLIHALYQNAPEETFSYDKVGNRTNGSGIAYTYGSGNRMLTRDTAAYTYDANGNTTSKAEGGGGTSYQYDYENRLVKVVLPNGTVAEYKYDALGRRVEKDVNGVVARYLYDGYNILSEYDDTGSMKARYTHNLAIDDPLAMERDGQVYYYHKDALGSITSLTDAGGQVVQTYEYDSFGNITNQSGNIENPFTYTGREYDKETGLYYYRARYYDPKAGRFVNEDPIGFEGGDKNLYSYVFNRPIIFNDPSGEIVPLIVAGAGVGAIVGGAFYAITTDNFKWQGLLGAAASGAIAGGVGVVAAPLAGALGLGSGVIGTFAVNMGAGAISYAAQTAIDPCIKFRWDTLGVSAFMGGAGGLAASKIIPIRNMQSFKQVSFPRTWKGILPFAGKNANRAIWLGGPVSVGVGIGGPYGYEQYF